MKNYYYIIVDDKNNPIDYYSDEYQYWVDVSKCDINESKVFKVDDHGLEEVNEMVECLNNNEIKHEGVKFPLKVAKIESIRNII